VPDWGRLRRYGDDEDDGSKRCSPQPVAAHADDAAGTRPLPQDPSRTTLLLAVVAQRSRHRGGGVHSQSAKAEEEEPDDGGAGAVGKGRARFLVDGAAGDDNPRRLFPDVVDDGSLLEEATRKTPALVAAHQPRSQLFVGYSAVAEQRLAVPALPLSAPVKSFRAHECCPHHSTCSRRVVS